MLRASTPGPRVQPLTVLARTTVGRAAVLGRRLVRRVDLAVVVAAAPELEDVVVGQVLDDLLEARIRAEEVVPDVVAARDRVLLELAVEGLVHLLDQHAVDIARQELVPLPAPHDLDDVPPGAAEQALQLLDHLAVAPHRPVEALEVAVDDEGQVVEAVAGGQRDAGDRLGLVHLAVAQERPHALPARVLDPAVLQVAVEARLVDRGEGAEAHRDRGELPEVGHEPRMRIGAEALALDLAPEVVELVLGEAPLEEGAGVDPGRRMALEEHLVAAAGIVLALEEVVEADLVQACRRGVRGEVAAEAGEPVVRPQHHRDGIPADQPADPPLHRLVTGEGRLLLGADRVDVPGAGEAGQPDVPLPGALEQLEHEEARAVLALEVDHLIERVEPVLGLGLVDVGQLVLELVGIHLGSVGGGRRSPGNGVQGSPVAARMRQIRELRFGGGARLEPSICVGGAHWGCRRGLP